MNLYLISQTENNSYDTYDSAIVAAHDEESAARIHPLHNLDEWKNWSGSWCSSADAVHVKLIGVANNDVPKGVVLASFNAG